MEKELHNAAKQKSLWYGINVLTRTVASQLITDDIVLYFSKNKLSYGVVVDAKKSKSTVDYYEASFDHGQKLCMEGRNFEANTRGG